MYQRVGTSPRFTALGTDIIGDNLTGLVWSASPSQTVLGWDEALTHCESLTIDEESDWRLPNVNELASLINAGEANSSTFLNAGGFSGVTGVDFWTSTTAAFDNGSAWRVTMDTGYIFPSPKSNGYLVLAVRGGL